MKTLIAAVLLVFANQVALAHGGGCLKSSPAGECCHTDHRTGVIHCH